MDSGQNFGNHRRVVPMYHVVTLLGSFIVFVGSIVNLVKSIGAGGSIYDASLILAMAFVLMLAATYARVFALKVQDRVIRMEENWRHFRRTGNMLDDRLTMRQIIGLRFASDDEYDELSARAISEGMSEKEIKQAIKNWRGDYVRA